MTWELWPMIGILTEAAGLPDTDKLAAEVMDAFRGSLEIAAGHHDRRQLIVARCFYRLAFIDRNTR
jgi:hypothetical protein